MKTPTPSARPKSLPDMLAIGISGLCLAHCLLLPVAIAALPVLGVFSEDEWVHQVLIGIAAPVSLWAIARSGNWRRAGILLPMLCGLCLLGAGAFFEPLHDYETPLSIAGALLLAWAHFRNARKAHAH